MHRLTTRLRNTSTHICIAIAFSALFFTSVNAQEVTPAQDYSFAVTNLLEKLGSIESGQSATDLSDAQVLMHFDTIERALAQFDTPAFPVNGIDTFESVCTPLNQISIRYALDGGAVLRQFRTTEAPTAEQIEAIKTQTVALIQRNAVRFENELAILQPSLARCQAAHLPFLTAFLATLPSTELTSVRLGGLRQMRHGMLQIILGVLTTSRDSSISAKNLQKYLSAISDSIDAFVEVMPLATRAELSQYLRTLPPVTEAAAVTVERAVNHALASTACTGLCLIE
jgi:hypothetical protein